MTSSSFWCEDARLEKRPPLDEDSSCDLVVVGSGIAGLSTSQSQPDGTVINAPAIRPLAKVEETAERGASNERTLT